MVETDIAGERVVLLPERALFWPRGRALLIADPHLGKAATFRAAAIAVPEGDTAADLARLDAALARSGAARLIVLGDLLHARAGREPALLEAVAAWLAGHPGLERLLVRGNHDRHAGDPPGSWGFRCVDEPWPAPPFVLRHHPEPDPAGYVLAGHLHPAARLRGRGRQRAQLPCFWLGAQVALLPAFGSFTGGAAIAPLPGDRVYVVADGEVLPVG